MSGISDYCAKPQQVKRVDQMLQTSIVVENELDDSERPLHEKSVYILGKWL